jgi:lipoprotein NlpI
MLASGAQAGSFQDFNLGVAACNRGDADAAIAAFSRALAAGDLAPNLQYIALFDRGVAYALKTRYVEAIADFSAVIKLKPDYFEAYFGRAQIYNATEQIAFAAADCETMISLKPDSHSPYALCGRIRFESGQYAQAASLFENALRLGEGRAAYNLLWLDLARMRAGQSDTGEIAKTARSVDVDGWPSPILDFFSGTSTPEAVDAAAAKGDAQTQRDQKCEVGFYLGEWQLGHNDMAAAKPLLAQAVSICPNNFIELEPAKVELNRLNQG